MEAGTMRYRLKQNQSTEGLCRVDSMSMRNMVGILTDYISTKMSNKGGGLDG